MWMTPVARMSTWLGDLFVCFSKVTEIVNGGGGAIGNLSTLTGRTVLEGCCVLLGCFY
jgi:hypothetical protein